MSANVDCLSVSIPINAFVYQNAISQIRLAAY